MPYHHGTFTAPTFILVLTCLPYPPLPTAPSPLPLPFRCMCFSATNVVSGQGRGVVVATGDSAEIGQINKMVGTVSACGLRCLCRRLSAGESLVQVQRVLEGPWSKVLHSR